MVGNVWEWTSSALIATVEPTFHVPETYKSIRGCAYDTYFENHATCHYQSGEPMPPAGRAATRPTWRGWVTR